MKVAKGIFGNKITYAAKNYDALKGADALAIVTEWQEFREPDFARMQEADARAGDLRRPQHLSAGTDEGARLHLLLDRTVDDGASRSSPAARATSAVTPSARCVDAGHAVVVLDDLSAGHAEALPQGVPLVQAAIHDRAAVAAAAASSIASTR